MHITLEDPTTKEVLAVLCVDRKARTCTILQCDIDHINEVTSIALGMKIAGVRMIVPLEIVGELEDLGWKKLETSVAMEKTNGK